MGIGAILLAGGVYLWIGLLRLEDRLPILKYQYNKEMKKATPEEERDIAHVHAVAVALIVFAWPFSKV